MSALHRNPLVSVILPVYNGAEFVGCALDSVVQQTYQNLEIFVVNDGSTDQTQSILNSWAAADPRIRVIHQANAGVARARNRAIAESTGEFIAPIDADDLWMPDKIAKQVQRMIAAGDNTGMVYSWWAWIDAQGNVLDRSPHWTISGPALEKLIFINFTGNASVPLYRRSCLAETGGYDEILAAANAGGCEDWDVALRVAARYDVDFVPEILLGYRRRPNSMSRACDTMWRSQQRVMEGIRKLRPDLHPALFQASANQFCMYLAGISYWAGKLRAAWTWGLRAGVRLPLAVAPYVLRMLLFPRPKPINPLVMRPGEKIETERFPEALLPYDRVGNRLRKLLIEPAYRLPQRLIHSFFLNRLRIERLLSRPPEKARVWATACWHFPIYSQTFVYREILALRNAGYEVRFAYSGLQARTELPDDAASVWSIRRRLPLFRHTAATDLDHYRRAQPQRVEDLTRRIAAASGLSFEQVYAHHHYRNAYTFTRMDEAWGAEYIHTYFFYEQALYGLVASTLLDLPRGVSCYADHMLDDYDLKLVALHMQTCDVVVATSNRIQLELETIAGAPIPGVVVKPNAIDATLFTERPPAPPGHTLKLVAVNRLHPKKGMSYLLEACVLLRDTGLNFSVEILGEPDHQDKSSVDYAEALKQFVAAHQLQDIVHFRGRQTASQVRAHLADANLFLAPFVELDNGDKDGIPTALLEGMAAGCAAIVTDAGSISEVVTHGVDGLVVPQRDSQQLAAAVKLLATDEALRDRLANAGVERIRNHFDQSRCEGLFHAEIDQAIALRDPFRSNDAAVCPPGKLRILLLSFEYPPETGFGGIGTYTWYQARALARLGHQVHVLAGHTRRHPLSMTQHDGVFVFRYRTRPLWAPIAAPLAGLKCFWTKSRLETAWSIHQGVRQLMTRYDYDILEMPECGAEGALITSLIRRPAIVRFHGPAALIMGTYDVPQADREMCSIVEQIAIDRSPFLNSCSQFLAREVAHKLGVTRAVDVIHNGIDLKLFDAEPAADLTELYGIPPGQITILFAGRMERRKGIHLCDAIAEIVLSRHDVTFLFAGDDLFGCVRETLLPTLAKKKLIGNIRYLGKLDFQQLRATAKAVDIYLLPSLWENCPYACLEAMAAGRAIVCANQGGMPELIEHRVNGLLAQTESPQSFAAQLEALILNPALRNELGLAARRTIEDRFTDDHIARETEQFYRACIARYAN